MATSTDVVFYLDREFVHISENLVCKYDVLESLEMDTWDYVAIFPVGWESLNSYRTYEYVTMPGHYKKGEKARCVTTFPYKYLPKEEEQYFQICYISRRHGARGASAPFQFRSTMDRDFVEQECEGMMVIRPRTDVMQEEIQNLNHKLMTLSTDRDALQSKLDVTEKLIAVRDQYITNLQAEMQGLVEAEGAEKEKGRKLQETVHANRTELQRLREEKEEVRVKLAKEQQTVEGLKNQVSQLQNTISTMQSDKDELSGQNQGLIDELNSYKMQVMESQTFVTQTSKTIERLNQALEAAYNESATYVEECEELKKKTCNDEKMLRQLNEQLKKVQQERELAETRQNDLRHELLNANDKLLACDAMKDKMVRDLDAYEVTQEKLNSTIMLQEAANRDLMEKLERQAKVQTATAADLDEMKRMLQVTGESLTDAAKTLQHRTDCMVRMEEKYAEVNDLYEETKKHLEVVSAQVATLSDEKAAMWLQLGEFEEELKKSGGMKPTELLEMAQHQTKEIVEKEEELSRLKQQNSSLDKRCEELNEKLQEVTALLGDACRAKNDLITRQDVMEDEIRGLRRREVETCFKGTELEEKVQSQMGVITSLRVTIGCREEEVEELKRRLDMCRLEFTRKVCENEQLRLQVRKSSEPKQGACANPAGSEKEKPKEEKPKKKAEEEKPKKAEEEKPKKAEEEKPKKAEEEKPKKKAEEEKPKKAEEEKTKKAEEEKPKEMTEEEKAKKRAEEEEKAKKRAEAEAKKKAKEEEKAKKKAKEDKARKEAEDRVQKYKRLYKVAKKEEESLQEIVALLKTEVATLEEKNSCLVSEVARLQEEARVSQQRCDQLQNAQDKAEEKPMAEEDEAEEEEWDAEDGKEEEEWDAEDGKEEYWDEDDRKEEEYLDEDGKEQEYWDDDDGKEKEEETTELMYGNPYVAEKESVDGEDNASSVATQEEEEEAAAASSAEPLLTEAAAGKEDQLPPPLEPEVLEPSSASATPASDSHPEEAAAEEGSNEIFEDCPAMPVADDGFMDAIGEGMKICPFCQASIMATSDFEEHVATHFGRICPVCRKQADDAMTPDDFEQHVNKCLDQELAASSSVDVD